LNSFQNVHFLTIDYIEHSRIKNKQGKLTEQCVDLIHLKQLCSKKCTIQERLCRHNTFCLIFNFARGYLSFLLRRVSELLLSTARAH